MVKLWLAFKNDGPKTIKKFMFKKIKKCVLPKRKRKRDDRDEFPIPSGNGDLEASTSGKVRPFCSLKMFGQRTSVMSVHPN